MPWLRWRNQKLGQEKRNSEWQFMPEYGGHPDCTRELQEESMALRGTGWWWLNDSSCMACRCTHLSVNTDWLVQSGDLTLMLPLAELWWVQLRNGMPNQQRLHAKLKSIVNERAVVIDKSIDHRLRVINKSSAIGSEAERVTNKMRYCCGDQWIPLRQPDAYVHSQWPVMINMVRPEAEKVVN